MNLSKFFIIVAVILAGSSLVFGILYITDPAGLRKDQTKVTAAKNEVPIFRPESLYWKNITQSAPWAPRDSSEVFLFQNKIWLMGGLNGNGKVNGNHVVEYWTAPHFNDIWNTEDGINWTQVATSSAWAPRRSMSVALFQNKLWMLGGWSPITGYTNDIWTSDDGINWTKVVEHAAFPAAEGQLLTVFQGKLWKIGGVNYNERQAKNDVWYSENGIDWTKVENIPWKPRWNDAIAIFNGKLYLTGGMNLADETFNDVWMTEDGLNWKLVTDNAPWAPRQGHTLEAYKGYLWLIGRLNDTESGGGPNDVWFSSDGITWQKTNAVPEWIGREDFLSAVFKDKIWIFSGMDANWQWRNDVWASDFLTITP